MFECESDEETRPLYDKRPCMMYDCMRTGRELPATMNDDAIRHAAEPRTRG